ncbi:MAG: T9SS type A sorting domain-containing protein, partial [Bacteroidia bacterium]
NGDGMIDAALLVGNNTGGLCGCATGVNAIVTTSPDIDFDGIPNGYTDDIDGDNRPNFMDIDSDGDGIVDMLEFQPTDAGYNAAQILLPDAFDGLIVPVGDTDLDDNGMLDVYPTGVSRISPVDTDSDGTPDYLDTNSDDNLSGGDSYSDFIEGNDANHNNMIDPAGEPHLIGFFPSDIDEDGLDDVFELMDINSSPTPYDNARASNSPVAPANQFGTVPVFRTVNNAFPVTLVNFDGNFINNQVLLTWKTASELNFDRFEVERSVDNVNFNKIGERAAKNGNQANAYDLIDNKPLINEGYVLYYRLKMVDKDGAVAKSNVVTVNVQTNSSVLLSAYPNPASDKLQISYFLKEAADAKIIIRDAIGREVYTSTVTTPNLWQNFELEVKDWTTGIYYLSINDGLSSQVTKIVVE